MRWAIRPAKMNRLPKRIRPIRKTTSIRDLPHIVDRSSLSRLERTEQPRRNGRPAPARDSCTSSRSAELSAHTGRKRQELAQLRGEVRNVFSLEAREVLVP